MERQLAPGMERLVSESGGGVELPSLFSGILNAVHRKQTLTLQDVVRTLNPAIHHPERMQHLYGTASPQEGVEACLRAVLGQLTLRQLLREEPPGHWVKGDQFVTDQWMDVLEDAPDEWISAIVWSVRTDEPSPGMIRDRARETRRAQIKALANKMAPEQEGLRKISRRIIAAIKKDYERNGLVEDRPEFKILRDQNGRILDGRHRLVAAQELGITWPEEQIWVETDEEALRIAVLRNRSHIFEPDLVRALRNAGLRWAHNDGQRELVKLEILADRQRPNREIARIVGCSPTLVGSVRDELEQTVQGEGFGQFAPIGGRPRDEGLRARVWEALEADGQQSNSAVAKTVGCNHHLVAEVRAEMEAAGVIAPYRAAGGRSRATPSDGGTDTSAAASGDRNAEASTPISSKKARSPHRKPDKIREKDLILQALREVGHATAGELDMYLQQTGRAINKEAVHKRLPDLRKAGEVYNPGTTWKGQQEWAIVGWDPISTSYVSVRSSPTSTQSISPAATPAPINGGAALSGPASSPGQQQTKVREEGKATTTPATPADIPSDRMAYLETLAAQVRALEPQEKAIFCSLVGCQE